MKVHSLSHRQPLLPTEIKQIKGIPAKRLPKFSPGLVQPPASHIKPSAAPWRLHAATASEASTSLQLNWEAFSKAVSGEWEGYHVSFGADGEPSELPRSVVPEAFRDWEIQVYDWQTQCSVEAKSDEVTSTLQRFLPTVGCEADAATVYDSTPTTWHQRCMHYLEDSSYAAAPESVEAGATFTVEHCLAEPPVEGQERRRVRLVHRMRRADAGDAVYVLSVGAFLEVWESVFNRGAVLCSCGSRRKPLNDLPRLSPADLEGMWRVDGSVRSWATGSVRPVAGEERGVPAAVGSSPVVFLPGHITSRVIMEGGAVAVEAGWAYKAGEQAKGTCRLAVQGGRLALEELSLTRLSKVN